MSPPRTTSYVVPEYSSCLFATPRLEASKCHCVTSTISAPDVSCLSTIRIDVAFVREVGRDNICPFEILHILPRVHRDIN
jgi:hypothetical protein